MRIRVGKSLEGGGDGCTKIRQKVDRNERLERESVDGGSPTRTNTRITENKEKHTKQTIACEHANHPPRKS